MKPAPQLKLALSVFGILLFLTGLFALSGIYEKNRRHARTAEFEEHFAEVAKKVDVDGAVAKLAKMPVAYKDRVQPLDSVARSELRIFTGKRSVYGQDPTLVFLTLAFDDKDKWKDIPLIYVGHGANKRLMKGMQDAENLATYAQIRESTDFVRAEEDARTRAQSGDFDKMSKAEQELLTLSARCRELENGFSHLFFVAPPYPGQEADEQHANDWHFPETRDLARHDRKKAEQLATAWTNLVDGWRERDGKKVASATDAVIASARDLGPQHFPETSKLEREIRFNGINPMTTASYFYMIASILMLGSVAFRIKAFRWLAFAVVFIGLGIQGYGFYERITLGFGVAITNLYESMIATAGICMIVTVLMDIKMKMSWATISGGLAAFFILKAVDIYSVKFDAGIGGTVAVLANNFWVHIHVPIVMASYAAFFIAWILAIVGMPMMLSTHGEAMSDELRGLYRSATVAAEIGTLLIFVGQVLGGVWAHDSWGRFWGWDPKETWAFILFFWYLILIHTRFVKTPPFLSLWWMYGGGAVLLFTYYGTNELLSGLHSYANSAGGGGFLDNLTHDKNRWFVVTMLVLILTWLAFGVWGFIVHSRTKTTGSPPPVPDDAGVGANSNGRGTIQDPA